MTWEKIGVRAIASSPSGGHCAAFCRRAGGLAGTFVYRRTVLCEVIKVRISEPLPPLVSIV
jgi:hypothetical protein